MPCPNALYHGMSLVGVMPSDDQMLNSFVLVPDLSPRLANVACVSMIALNASLAEAALAALAGSSLGPRMMKSLYITSKRSLASPIFDELIFRLAGVHEQDIGVALLADRDRLPGADGDDIDAAVAQLLEIGQDVIEQAGIGGAGGGGELQHLLAGRGGRCSSRFGGSGRGLSGRRCGSGRTGAQHHGDDHQTTRTADIGRIFMRGLLVLDRYIGRG